MKKLLLLLLISVSFTSYTQNNTTKEITADIEQVTLYLDGAKIERKADKIKLGKGITVLNISNISPFIEQNSIQISLNGSSTLEKIDYQIIKPMESSNIFGKGNIQIYLKSSKSTAVNLSLSYLVYESYWRPSYDIVVKDINTPLHIKYKASVIQNTQVNWENIKLIVSAESLLSKSNNSELKPNYLGSNSDYDVQNLQIDNNKPDQKNSKDHNNDGSGLDDDILESDVKFNLFLSKKSEAKHKKKNKNSTPIQAKEMDNEPEFIAYDIEELHTINSNGSALPIVIGEYDLNANYIYHITPRIKKTAVLHAKIANYKQFNFLSGEANVFFENNFFGKTTLNVTDTSDNVEMSLGVDHDITVSRAKLKDLEEVKLSGSKKTEYFGFKNEIKNNKNQTIKVVVLDQIPISQASEISIEVENKNDGTLNKKTGELKWEFELAPNSSKQLELIYSVKYPKDENLIIE